MIATLTLSFGVRVVTLKETGLGVTHAEPVCFFEVADSLALFKLMVKEDVVWSPRNAAVTVNVTTEGSAMRTVCDTVASA